jgi:ATP-binding cassette, subfamily B, bacterial
MIISHDLRRLWCLRRSVELVWRSSPRTTFVHAGLMIVLGFLPVASLYLLKLIIDALTKDELAGSEWTVLAGLLTATVVLAVGTDWLRALDIYVSEAQSHRVVGYIHELINRQSLRLDLAYYENPDFHDNFHRAQTEAPHRPPLIVDRLIGVLQNVISLSGIFVLLFAFQWKLTLWVFIAVVPILIVRLKNADVQHRSWRTQTSRLRQIQYLNHLISHQDHAKEVRLFNLSSHLHQRFIQLQDSIWGDQCLTARRRAIGEGIIQSCASLGNYGALAFLAHQAVAGKVNIGEVVVYYQALQRGQSLLRELFSNAAGLLENTQFLSNFYDFLMLEPKVREPAEPRAMAFPCQGEISFENIGFDYPSSPRRLLKDVNLTIRSGETIAIVGRNGAGKTTLVKLLCRLYDPTEGRITVDGVDLRELATAEWRQQIGVVFQDFGRYHFSVRENIAIGDFSAINAPERIEEAALLSGASATIACLSQGYETQLGTLFPGGEDLSIGQWQQIAIARAALRSASIVILDEPTSALDPQAEAELLERFRQLTEGRTAIIISHRLSTVRLADRICVIDEGRVAESGTHAELLQLNQLYASMYRAQARRYLFE